MAQTKEPEVIYQIKISLDRLSPPVWRRGLTPAVPLELLHFIIHKAMGWDSAHAYQFLVDKKTFVAPVFADRWSGEDDGSKVRLSQIVRGWKKKFKYLYDYGDSWLHTIEVEGKVP